MATKREFVAKHRFARMAARKARLSADMIRGKDVNSAMQILGFSPRRASAFYLKVLKSATANASQDEMVNVNRLFVSDVRADDGPLHAGRLRWRPGPQGRAMPYRKRTCHLTVVVREMEDESRGRRSKRTGGKASSAVAEAETPGVETDVSGAKPARKKTAEKAPDKTAKKATTKKATAKKAATKKAAKKPKSAQGSKGTDSPASPKGNE